MEKIQNTSLEIRRHALAMLVDHSDPAVRLAGKIIETQNVGASDIVPGFDEKSVKDLIDRRVGIHAQAYAERIEDLEGALRHLYDALGVKCDLPERSAYVPKVVRFEDSPKPHQEKPFWRNGEGIVIGEAVKKKRTSSLKGKPRPPIKNRKREYAPIVLCFAAGEDKSSILKDFKGVMPQLTIGVLHGIRSSYRQDITNLAAMKDPTEKWSYLQKYFGWGTTEDREVLNRSILARTKVSR